MGWIGFAIRTARRSLASVASAEALNNLGDALQGLGEVKLAIAAYRKSGDAGSAPSWASNLLFCLCYDPGTTAKGLHRAATEWARRYAPRRASKPGRRGGGVRLKVGVLSSDLRDHPVGRNVLGLFEHRREVELHAYAEVARGDAVTERFRAHADGWTSTVGRSDEEVAEGMRRDGLDVLVVLAGHTARNRPLVAAYGGAPVQVSFHDLTTSGLSAMDWWVTDGVLHPEGTRERFTERLWRLPHFYLHRAPEEAPAVGGLPSAERGWVTFVSCNNPAKLTAEVVRLWSRVLAAVPRSRLMLKYVDWFSDPTVRRRYVALFERNGIAAGRLDFRGRDLRRSDQLALLNEADVALDPFPFNGSTTSFEALWMGVPVVTQAGERFVGRVGASVLTALGLEELVATDEEGYVAKAVALAEDRARLGALRQSLRPRLAASPLCDAAGYTRTFEAALRGMAG
jgi:predicted O-linked N-acetylglucosamine transferase (SPINDLY family)